MSASLAVDRGEPCGVRGAACCTEAEPQATQRRRGSADHQRGLEGSRLGHAGLADDGDRTAQGRALRDQVETRRPFRWACCTSNEMNRPGGPRRCAARGRGPAQTTDHARPSTGARQLRSSVALCHHEIVTVATITRIRLPTRGQDSRAVDTAARRRTLLRRMT